MKTFLPSLLFIVPLTRRVPLNAAEAEEQGYALLAEKKCPAEPDSGSGQTRAKSVVAQRDSAPVNKVPAPEQE